MTPDQRARAACRGMSISLFYPDHRGQAATPEAEAACRGCEVRPECLAEALAYACNDDQGYRGGFTSDERREIRRRRARGAA